MPPPKRPHTVGSASFDPESFFASWDESSLPQNNDLRACIIRSFNLKSTDNYVYHAIASVTLSQVQQAINHGEKGGLHAWYVDDEGKPIPPPPPADIAAYTNIFSSQTATAKALTAFAANAKKGSLRADIAAHLQSHFLPPSPETELALPNKLKAPFKNPYYDVWAWSCTNLEWAGPTSTTDRIKQSHHILPVLYHHFSCVCPSYDALVLIQQLAHGSAPLTNGKDKNQKKGSKETKPIVEIGSGNGYWAHLLRRFVLTVHAVDNALSLWRTTWIGDTILADGVAFLTSPPKPYDATIQPGAKNAILLLVYPQVSDDFTGRVIRAYEGDTVVVAGTQNGNGYTGFRDETIGRWMERERGEFERVAQVMLPSFAGKDEALFVFRRRRGTGSGNDGLEMP